MINKSILAVCWLIELSIFSLNISAQGQTLYTILGTKTEWIRCSSDLVFEKDSSFVGYSMNYVSDPKLVISKSIFGNDNSRLIQYKFNNHFFTIWYTIPGKEPAFIGSVYEGNDEYFFILQLDSLYKIKYCKELYNYKYYNTPAATFLAGIQTGSGFTLGGWGPFGNTGTYINFDSAWNIQHQCFIYENAIVSMVNLPSKNLFLFGIQALVSTNDPMKGWIHRSVFEVNSQLDIVNYFIADMGTNQPSKTLAVSIIDSIAYTSSRNDNIIDGTRVPNISKYNLNDLKLLEKTDIKPSDTYNIGYQGLELDALNDSILLYYMANYTDPFSIYLDNTCHTRIFFLNGKYEKTDSIIIGDSLNYYRIVQSHKQRDGSYILALNHYPKGNTDSRPVLARLLPNFTLDTFKVDSTPIPPLGNIQAMDTTIYLDDYLTYDTLALDSNQIIYQYYRSNGIDIVSLKPLQMDIYPNPASDEINLIIPPSFQQEPFAMMLMDATGKVVMQDTWNGTRQTLSVAELPNGFYVISLTKKNGVHALGKFIKTE